MTVEAIKQKSDIEAISRKLLIVHSEQYSQIWNLGIQLALRISDLLSVKFTDVQNGRLVLRESKTGKTQNIALNSKAKSIIHEIKEQYPDGVYLFQSYHHNVKTVKPLSRIAVAKAFKATGDDLNLRLGTHSMRKTRGYHVYKQTNDIASVMKMLNHSSERETLRYIGITQDSMDEVSMIEL
ncbi:Integrase [Vibrio owensii]|uniref:Integrase n=1 Tax=Vibrio owensii TaxID=696485 RepID=A0AAU9Q4R9_9VIBR|nr:Integrase [Vibrio owensii]